MNMDNRLEVFDAPDHLLGGVHLSDKHQCFNDLADTTIAAWKVHDAGVTRLTIVEAGKVSVIGDQNTAGFERIREVRSVGLTTQPGVISRQSVDPSTTKLNRNGGRHVLIKLKADVRHGAVEASRAAYSDAAA